jgi:Glucodextranase, domain B
MVSFAVGRPADRSMPSPTGGHGPERSSQARAITLPGADDSALTMGRRIGVLVVLAALLGAILLAANGSGSGQRGGVAALATATPVPAPSTLGAVASNVPIMPLPVGVPEMLTPKATLVSKRLVDLRVVVPDPGVAWDGLQLLVLRGGRAIATQSIGPGDLTKRGRVTIKRVPLKRGTNSLSVALGNPGGQGPASAAVSIRLDDQPPRLKILSPRMGATLNQPTVIVRGRTGPGLPVVVRNVTTGQRIQTNADASGAFHAEVELQRGRDTIAFAVRDPAGNLATKRFAIVRGNGDDEATLHLSRGTIRHASLPATLDATVTVLGADGSPIGGVPVEFVVAPSGPPAMVREFTTNKDGRAVWSGIRIPRDAEAGDGLVSVRVTLPDGRVLTDTAHLKIS